MHPKTSEIMFENDFTSQFYEKLKQLIKMKLSEISKGQEVNCPDKGKGTVIKKTPKTLTVKFEFSTVKTTYYDKDFEINYN
jgi:hypothetical protein